MRQSISNFLLLLFLLNTFGFGLLEWSHHLAHWFPNDLSKHSIHYYHLHNHDEVDGHTHGIGDHFHHLNLDDQANDLDASLLVEFLTYPFIIPDLPNLQQYRIEDRRLHVIRDVNATDDAFIHLTSPPPELPVI